MMVSATNVPVDVPLSIEECQGVEQDNRRGYVEASYKEDPSDSFLAAFEKNKTKFTTKIQSSQDTTQQQ